MKNIQEHEYLSYKNRPKNINNGIDYAYNKISERDASNWKLYNGHDQYNLFPVSETYLLQNLIRNNKEQKEFYILEVGAGNFQFGRYLAKFINQQVKDGALPNDITVNIISTRGERNLHAPYSKEDNCQLWELGNFKIENLIEEFNNKNFDNLNGKFDLIVSNYTLRHLVDPLGTFLQMHDLLKKGGIILTDTFDFKAGSSNNCAYNAAGILLSYLHDAGDEILAKEGLDARSYSIIAVRKQGDDVKIPLNYNYYTTDNDHNSYCQVFSSNEAPKHYANKLLAKVYGMYITTIVGNKSLFTLFSDALLQENRRELSQKEEMLSDKLALEEKYKEMSEFLTFDEYVEIKQECIDLLKEEIKSLENGDYLENKPLFHGYTKYHFVDETVILGVTEDYN